MHSIHFNIHGICITVQSEASEVIRDFCHDFHYFLVPEHNNDAKVMRITHFSDTSPTKNWFRLFQFRRATFYLLPIGGRRVCFFKKAWIDYHFYHRYVNVYSELANIAYEVVRDVLLSYTGEALDRKGIHKVHGLGLSYNGKGSIFLAASGTGKSVLAMDVLKTKGPGILSDDTPLVTLKRGEVELLPFPQRIALRDKPQGVANEYIRQFRREKYGEKFVVGAAGFHEQIVSSAKPAWIVLTTRKTSGEPKMASLERTKLLWPILRWMVIGHETPQVWELFVRLGPRDLLAKVGILFSRIRVGVALLRSTRALRFEISPNKDANVRMTCSIPEFA